MRERLIAERIREGSEAAFEELFRAHCEALCAFGESYVRSPGVAEDLVHDVFCDVWDRRAGFEPEGSVKSYLYRAVRNKTLNWLKHQRVRRAWQEGCEHEAPRYGESAAKDVESRELEQALAHALEGLSERQRHVYLIDCPRPSLAHKVSAPARNTRGCKAPAA